MTTRKWVPTRGSGKGLKQPRFKPKDIRTWIINYRSAGSKAEADRIYAKNLYPMFVKLADYWVNYLIEKRVPMTFDREDAIQFALLHAAKNLNKLDLEYRNEKGLIVNPFSWLNTMIKHSVICFVNKDNKEVMGQDPRMYSQPVQFVYIQNPFSDTDDVDSNTEAIQNIESESPCVDDIIDNERYIPSPEQIIAQFKKYSKTEPKEFIIKKMIEDYEAEANIHNINERFEDIVREHPALSLALISLLQSDFSVKGRPKQYVIRRLRQEFPDYDDQIKSMQRILSEW
jgi:hypothetical protein